MGYPEAQRGDFGPGVPDEQEGELNIWGQQEWRVLRLCQVRPFFSSLRLKAIEIFLMPLFRMIGPVSRGEHRVSWASRSSPHSSATSSGSHSRSSHPTMTFFSPGDHRLVDASPLPVDAPTRDGRLRSNVPHPSAADSNRLHQTAPALLGAKYHLPTPVPAHKKYSLDQRTKIQTAPAGFELDPSAPTRAMRSHQGSSASDSALDGQGKTSGATRSPTLEVVNEEEERRSWGEPEVVQDGEDGNVGEGAVERHEPSWGDTFAVEWISTERVPFHRTRHLRNPWNHDREVKVSRDGTELEPSVGKRLLDEWDKLSDPHEPLAVVVPKTTSGGKRGLGTKHSQSLLPPSEGPTEGGGSSKSGLS